MSIRLAEQHPLVSCTYDSFLGRLTLAASDDGLRGLWLDGQKYFAGSLDAPMVEGRNVHLEAACAWLDRYFEGKNPPLSSLVLLPSGSGFRQVVWQLLCEIPWGQTCTYGQLAQKAARNLGKERVSARAVGGAVGHNPISIIIPCHRVVGANGSLTGYAGGMERKLMLLRHEGVGCSGFGLAPS